MKKILPVSIIIPAKNEATHLPILLESIKKQTVQPLEIILSDAKSIDNTVSIAKSFGIKIIEGGMPSVARNNGAEIAQSDIFVFMDADTYFIKDTDLQDIIQKFSKKNFDIASCYFKTNPKNKRVDIKILEILFNILKWFGTRSFNQILRGDFAGFLIIKKDPFNKVNGFDENLSYMEDVSIVRKLLRLGYSHGVIKKLRLGIDLGREKKGEKSPLTLKMILGAILSFISIILSSYKRTQQFAYRLNKKAISYCGTLGGIVEYKNPYSPEDRSQGYPLGITRGEKRFWEIFTGVLFWLCLLIPLVLAILKLDVVFVIYVAFLVAYWSVRTVKFVLGIAIGVKKIKKETSIDWISRIKKEYPKEFDELNFIYLCPVYAEDLDILKPSFKAFSNSTVGADKIEVVLAIEEKKAEMQLKNYEYLKEKYGKKFKSMQYYIHPTGIPGEIAGVKGANINWAIRHFVKELKTRGEDISKYLLITCDSDMRPHEKYLSAIAYRYLEKEEEGKMYYYASALHTFMNNIWSVPHIIRAQSNMLTLVLLYGWVFDKKKTFLFNGEEMYIRDSFSSYVVNLKTLENFKFWDPEIANDDTAFYWNAMVRSKGTFKSQEVYIPTYNDAVENTTYWKSHMSYYKQQYRWGWGSINVPITLAAITKDKKDFPLYRKIMIFGTLFEYQIWYLSVIFILTFGLYIMGVINPSYNFTVYSYNLAQVMSMIFLFITLLNIPIFVYRRILIPVPKNWKWWRHVLDFIEIVFITINMLTFGFVPYIQAKTEMMLGLGKFKRNFYVTEKVKIKK
ncbi:TPA: hypothetical protein DEP90_01530 [Patescibacteria group bacterium]|nr:hypothetical protein [Patescibacteria group bacterium]